MEHLMGSSGNGVSASRNNGSVPPPSSSGPRAPRRLVLLRGGEDSEVAEVLAEYQGADVSGKRLHADLQRQAAGHPGQYVAAEWLGKLGWTRFLWCRK
jgi:hypothetical protein